MKRVLITRVGGPEVLELRELADPLPGRGEVRVRLRAIGVNFADILMRMGLYPGAPKTPFVPGYEASGQVDAVGPEVAAWRPGDRVIVPTNYGAYTDTLIAPAQNLFRLPDDKSFESAAALTVNYLTAYLALIEQGGLRRGASVLIHGAAGGVGIAAVQIAKIYDARIFGTASAAKHDFLRQLGVERPIDYLRENFETIVRRATDGRGVQLALDPVGGAHFKRSYACLAPMGRLILYGFSAAAASRRRRWGSVLWQYMRTPSFSPMKLMLENRSVIGLHLGRLTEERALLTAGMQQLLSWWTAGKIEPVVGTTFPLSLVARAHDYIQDRQNIGKVVLTVEGRP